MIPASEPLMFMLQTQKAQPSKLWSVKKLRSESEKRRLRIKGLISVVDWPTECSIELRFLFRYEGTLEGGETASQFDMEN